HADGRLWRFVPCDHSRILPMQCTPPPDHLPACFSSHRCSSRSGDRLMTGGWLSSGTVCSCQSEASSICVMCALPLCAIGDDAGMSSHDGEWEAAGIMNDAFMIPAGRTLRESIWSSSRRSVLVRNAQVAHPQYEA